jgi:phosphoglycolate phosphatase
MTYVLCWDIDGTLLTTGRAGVFAFEQAIRDVCGVEPDLMDVPTSGLTDHEVAYSFLDQCGYEPTPEAVADVLRRYEEYLPDRLGWRKGSVLPGVQETLRWLSARDDVLLLLLTGNTAAGAWTKLTHYGLGDYFEGGAFCVNGGRRESIAEEVRAVARERLGHPPDPERFYVIGDTPADVRCGKAIGARTIAIASGVYSADVLRLATPWALYETLPGPSAFAALIDLPPEAVVRH